MRHYLWAHLYMQTSKLQQKRKTGGKIVLSACTAHGELVELNTHEWRLTYIHCLHALKQHNHSAGVCLTRSATIIKHKGNI